MSERTEQPTPKKLRDARGKGEVATSKEVVSAGLIVAIFALFFALGTYYVETMGEMMILPADYTGLPLREALPRIADGLAESAFSILAPLLLLVLVVGVAANYFQFGFLFVLEPLKPKAEKLSPATNIKNIFSMKNLVEFFKSIIKISVLSASLYFVITDGLPDLLQAPRCGLDCVLAVAAALLAKILIATAVAFVVLAAADFFFERFQHTKKLKMTKDEVKREYKEAEGDPIIKSKRKHLHQELMMQNTTERVRKSSVLVTNPTRIAIAIYYDEEETPLPVVVAKGQDHVARRMIEVAREEGIPVMENVPLARALHEDGDVDRYIPSELIEAVAEVLKWVQQVAEQK